MIRHYAFSATFLLSVIGFPLATQAHFIWLATDEEGSLQVYFSESAEPDDPSLLKYAQNAVVHEVTAQGQAKKLSLKADKESLVVQRDNGKKAEVLYVAHHDLGVMERGGKTFLLKYYAKTGPEAGQAAWRINTHKQMALDVVPERRGDQLVIQAFWQGKPLAGAEFNVARPGKGDVDGSTDEAGKFSVAVGEAGTHSIRVKHVEATKGELAGKPYGEIRHYATLALLVGEEAKPLAKSKTNTTGKSPYPAIPEMVTSFGGAIAKGQLYTYGGHTGSAHSYSTAEQGHVLRRLNLQGQGEWETLVEGPPLQGLAMVASEGKVYRIGGFTAKNAEGEDHDLWSDASVACFDPQTKKWQEMPALPEPRSSFDAAVLDGAIYVIGGWQLQGEAESKWHSTAWKLDLSAKSPAWLPLPTPPFQRRALTVAAHQGKLYAIGGMQPKGGPTTRVDVLDPQTGKWTEAGQLQGDPMTGFGSSAFATGGQLYVSTIKGNLQRLSKDGKHWEIVRETPTARFFHRMLPLDDHRFIMVGGANMGIGKFDELEILSVP